MPIWVCLGSFLFRLYPEQYGVVLLCPASGFSALVTDCNLFLFRKTHRPFFFAHSLWTDIFFALLASDTSFHCVLISTFGGYLIIGVDPFFVILHYLYTIFIRLCCIIYSSSTLYTWLCIIYGAAWTLVWQPAIYFLAFCGHVSCSAFITYTGQWGSLDLIVFKCYLSVYTFEYFCMYTIWTFNKVIHIFVLVVCTPLLCLGCCFLESITTHHQPKGALPT